MKSDAGNSTCSKEIIWVVRRAWCSGGTRAMMSASVWLLIDGQDVPALAQECRGFDPGTTPQINGESGGMVSLSETADRLPK
jgi:hypothetical protein